MRKPTFCICENKDADQLGGNREADQHLCFHYIHSTIPLLPKSEISSLYLYSVIAQPGLRGTWSKTPKTGFLTTRLIFTAVKLAVYCIGVLKFIIVLSICDRLLSVCDRLLSVCDRMVNDH